MMGKTPPVGVYDETIKMSATPGDLPFEDPSKPKTN